ncbi:Uncharacterized protein CTRI78_v004777 [Colletotrichum trifolii]|uniref:Subtelomeric hrmA-associated cluster protein AFUB-079030/YDR124W-like helical bundle domain-containing protein n=1 Tax=Colletotrichum trifolii TaxID=5466 RepID=A0A4V3HWR4_COLTR|nr:Uncharacterized protein CTRI78_v004777 [Colletotrichum trifolii]
MVRDFPREPYPRQWHPERYPANPPPLEDGRYHESQDVRRPPLEVGKALRDHCNIPARYFFVAAIMDDGTTQMFSNTQSGPGARHQANAFNRFFNMKTFVRHVRGADAAPSPLHDDSEFSFDGDNYQQGFGGSYAHRSQDRRRAGEMFEDDSSYKARKRHRGGLGGGYRRHIDDDDDVLVSVPPPSTRGLKVGNDKEVWAFYEQRFKNCQQTACKLIAKAWVKVVEPKKQTNHPYTGQDEKAPDWWPKPHKEPDHLYKRERVHLLCHILRMIVEPPEKQHPSILKMNLNVQKLEEATTEAMSAFFSDKENKANAKKKPYLDEIFKVARGEERYKRGETDGDMSISVMSEDKFPDAYPSDNEDNGFVKEEDEHHQSMASSASPSKAGPQHDLLHTSSNDHSPAGPIPGGAYLNEMPLRNQPYSTQMLPSNMHSEHHYVESSSMHSSGNLPLQELVPTPHDPHRRPSMYGSQAEYSNTNPTGMYTQAWQGGSTAPGGASVYSFTPQPAGPASGHFNNTSVPLAQNQYMPTPYESMSRGGFDQGGMFRPVPASQTPVQNAQAFSGYLPTDARGLPGNGVKADSTVRSQIH